MASAEASLLRITLACGKAGSVRLEQLQVPAGSTIEDVLQISGILKRRPDLNPASITVGIFNRERPRSFRVRDGDRVEIYRPLLADPKETRRRRAAAQRRRKQS